ncbi:MAG: hypothetical protein SF053_04580 [Bacteroidia bacterium]|nr:hypothetical protein [Bacteroidia bacterium]
MNILTIAIGLMLTYLILSLIASGIQETLANWFSLRARYFGRALDLMLTNPAPGAPPEAKADTSLLEAFKGHAYFQHLLDDTQKLPSYMQAQTFSSILMHVLDGRDVAAVKDVVSKMSDGNLKKFLLDSLQEANNDLSAFRLQLERWYDEVMDTLSGRYKRLTHNILLIIGLGLGVYMNADSLQMYQKMTHSADPAQQTAQILAIAAQLTDSQAPAMLERVASTERTRSLAASDTVADTTLTTLIAQNSALISQAQALVTELREDSSPLGLGWSDSDLEDLKKGHAGTWALKLLGFFVTAIAVSLGAPFWFDLLQRFMNIRTTGAQK